MRHFPSSWSDSLLARLGFRRKPRKACKRDRSFMRRRLQMESLEVRAMLASDLYVVTTLLDTVDPNDGVMSLREAIAIAAGDDSTTDNDTIQFDASLFANGPGTITLAYDGADAGTAPDQLLIDSDVTVSGPGQDVLSISGNDLTRVFKVSSGVTASIEAMTVERGSVTGTTDGAGISSEGNLTLDAVTVTDNHSEDYGGGIFSSGGTLLVTNSTISLNSANVGGAISGRSDAANSVVIHNSAILNNSAANYAGLHLAGFAGGGTAHVSNTTFSGNESNYHAGAIQLAPEAPHLTVVNSTITDNQALDVTGQGGGIRAASHNQFTLHNTIVAGNTAGAGSHNISNNATSTSSYNLIGYGGSGGIANNNNGNIVLGAGVSAGLAPLADNGGPTWTHALLANSPAIDKGSNAQALDAAGSPLALDQRGNSRLVDSGTTGPTDGIADIGAFEFEFSGQLVVSTLTDEDDGSYTPGDLSLREALSLAALQPGADVVTFMSSLFASGPASITLAYDGADSGANPDQLVIDSDVTIVGPGASQLSLDGSDLTRVLLVNAGVNVEISGVTITKGKVTGSVDGGGIYNSGDLILDGVVLHDNEAGRQGGGIYSASGATLQLVGSTVSANSASEAGGVKTRSSVENALIIEHSAIINNVADAIGGLFISGESSGTTKTAKIINSTFSGNSSEASHAGALLVNGGFNVTIVNSTITNNSAYLDGGGVRNSGSAITLHNTIVAGNTSANASTYDWYGTSAQSPSSNNLIGINGSINLTNNVNGNQVGTTTPPLNPGLAPLADNGGNTWTHALLADSPAIDKGSNALALDAAGSALTVDQRGLSRDVDSGTAGPSGGTVDIGAFEFAFSPPIVVSTLADEDDGNYGAGDLSLREALALANLIPGTETITFAASLFTAGPVTITLSYDGMDGGTAPDPLSANGVVIQGPGAHLLTINGGNQTRVMNASDATIEGVTITGGIAAYGGGIAGSNIVLKSVRVVGNESTGDGGGIYVGWGSLELVASEVSENTAVGRGGGVFHSRQYTDYELKIENSTISGNEAGDKGGGVYSYLYQGDYGGNLDATIKHSTISGNSADEGGGVFTYQRYGASKEIKVHNTIIAGNLDLVEAPSDVAGDNLDVTSSFNLIGQGGSGGLQDENNGNIVLSGAESAGLSPLGFFGGRTRTHSLRNGSPAIDAGDPLATVGTGGIPNYDQRGSFFGRVADGNADETLRLDIGAFESQKPLLQVDTLSDENDGYYGPDDFSLREAIALAALMDGEDIIMFAPGLFASGAQMITLSHDGVDSGTAPDELFIDNNVIIEGPGSALLSISGGNATRVFQVASVGDVEISDLTISGGNAGSADGGGILNFGSLTLNGVIVSESSARFGGGIYTSGADSSLSIATGRIVDNAASDQKGGGIYVAGGDVAIDSTTIDGNFANVGAGLYLDDAVSFELSSSTVSRNNGAGVFSDADFQGTQLHVNSTISGNLGTGLVVESADASAGITVLNCTITENSNRGLQVDGGVVGVSLQNAIVAGNEGASDVYGVFAASSECNVIGVIDGATAPG